MHLQHKAEPGLGADSIPGFGIRSWFSNWSEQLIAVGRGASVEEGMGGYKEGWGLLQWDGVRISPLEEKA